MSNTVKGFVSGVEIKPTRNPKYKLNFFFIGKDKYSTKFTHPGVQEGDYVEFIFEEVENNGYINKEVNPKAIKKVDPPSTNSGAVAAPPAVGRDAYWENKEARDIDADLTRRWNAARSTAVDVMKLAVSCGVDLKVGNKKQVPDLDMILALLDSTTESLFISGSNTEYMNQLLDVGQDVNSATEVAYNEDIE